MTLPMSRIPQLNKLKENLTKEYESGMSQEEIGSKYGFSTATISNHMRELGITARSRTETSLRHGHNVIGKRSGTYNSWDTMIQRCTNPKNDNYRNYGARGIRICERWLTFVNFLADMGKRPARLTLERIDNSRGYEPGNCEWVTRKQQLNNRRGNVIVEYNGKTLTLAQWAELLGLDYMNLWYKYRRAGTWPPK